MKIKEIHTVLKELVPEAKFVVVSQTYSDYESWSCQFYADNKFTVILFMIHCCKTVEEMFSEVSKKHLSLDVKAKRCEAIAELKQKLEDLENEQNDTV